MIKVTYYSDRGYLYVPEGTVILHIVSVYVCDL
jgi:hypothetical protein